MYYNHKDNVQLYRGNVSLETQSRIQTISYCQWTQMKNNEVLILLWHLLNSELHPA